MHRRPASAISELNFSPTEHIQSLVVNAVRSGEQYSDVIDALLEVKAFESLRLLREAAELLFEDGQAPTDRALRNSLIKDHPKEG